MKQQTAYGLNHLTIIFSLLFLFLSPSELRGETIKFRIVAVNPSSYRTQRVPVKIYLPEEVKPKNVLDLGGLSLDFDAQKSLFYVYKDNVVLKPKETRIFEVEVEDIWVIPEGELQEVRKRANNLLEVLRDTDYFLQAKNLAKTTEELIKEIIKTQNDDTVSRSQHIGIYRTNVKALARLKEEIAEMEKLLEAPRTVAPIFDKKRFKKTLVWIIVFSVMVFVGFISLVLFFTMRRQSKITDETFLKAKLDSLLEEEKAKEKKS